MKLTKRIKLTKLKLKLKRNHPDWFYPMPPDGVLPQAGTPGFADVAFARLRSSGGINGAELLRLYEENGQPDCLFIQPQPPAPGT